MGIFETVQNYIELLGGNTRIIMGHYHLLGIFHGGMVDGPLNDQKNIWVGKTPRKSAKRVQSTRKYVNIEMLRFQSMALRAFWSLCLSSTSICITNKLKPLNNFKNQMQYRLKKLLQTHSRTLEFHSAKCKKNTTPAPSQLLAHCCTNDLRFSGCFTIQSEASELGLETIPCALITLWCTA